jgi:2'-5' RNA ligase
MVWKGLRPQGFPAPAPRQRNPALGARRRGKRQDLDVPRLFTGLEVPSNIAAELATLRGGISGARWIAVENYHFTLRFIGDIDERMAGEAADVLGEIRRPSLIVTIDGLGWFGADRPRAIIARIRPTAPLVELQADQERRLRRIGLEPETRKFSPHITLARLRSGSPHAVADYLSARGYFSARQFEAKRFVLFSARDSTGGGPYLVEAAYGLGETGAP